VGLAIHGSADGMTDAVTMFASVVVMLIVIYMGIRFLLVSPLTLSSVEPSVKISWQMTQGHWWRILWGYFCIGWSVFVVFAVAFLVLIALMFLTGSAPDSVFFVAGLSALGAFYSVVNLAMSCIYFCVACRILMAENQEKRAFPTQVIMQ
jgi:membrane-anchored glycerophosphoryl diester phosphodiesterase (GDPDase)